MLTLKPYRFTPPLSVNDRSLERPRLVDIMDGRFERRLTFLRAGPGFGKTTLLCQAIANNLEDSFGIDVWFSCGPPDNRDRELSAGLLTALGVNGPSESPLETIVDAVWKESPRNIALFLDDVHHLEPGGTGAAFLEQLVLSLPLNAHLVLASRDEIPFSVTRLEAAGEVARIDEAMLSFDPAERSEFLGDRGVAEANDLGGWPAALELAAAYGGERVGDYVWDEVIAHLAPESARTLARLAPLEWIDSARIQNVAGSHLSAEELIAPLPLTSRGADGAFRLHALWGPVLARIDTQWTSAELDRAVLHLCAEESYREATIFCKEVDQPHRIIDVVRSMAGLARWLRFSTADFETILSELPKDLRAEPLGQLIEGIFGLHTDPPVALPLFAAAQAGFRKAGEVELELSVLMAQAFLASFAGSAEFLTAQLAPTLELEHPAQSILVKLTQANLCILEGRPQEALKTFDEVQAIEFDLCGVDRVTAGIAALDAGQPERAMHESSHARRHATPVMRAAARTTENEARWLLGEVEVDEIRIFDTGVPDQMAGHMHNGAVFLAGLAFQNATFGRLAPARTQIELLRRVSMQSIGPRARMAIAAAEMAFATLEGNVEQARAVMTDALENAPTPVRFHRHSFRAMPLLWVLEPGWRERIDALKLGPCFARGLDAARALIDFREGRGGEAAAALDWSRPRQFEIFFVPSMVLELAIAATAAGNDAARDRAQSLSERYRETLRDLAQTSAASSPTEKSVAQHLLTTVAPRPAETLAMRTLGPMELWRGDQLVQDPLLRRDRVRAILEYLVLHPTTTRGKLGAALWPERDETTVTNNLRVNLNHLIRLLEPARAKDEPSYFVETDRDTIRLRIEDGLDVDSMSFDREIDAALQADREGRTAAALNGFEKAMSIYRGDYFADSPNADWGEIERTRLRSRFIAAAVRAASLRVGKGDFPRALDHLSRALAFDDLHETAYRLQGLTYLRSGDRSAARAALLAGVQRLRSEGLEPGDDLLRLLRRVENGAISR